MKGRLKVLFFIFLSLLVNQLSGQDIQRERPKEWDGLVKGGAFIDLFLPIPTVGTLTSATWGAANVKPRYIENGIEDSEWSYWGGNILVGPDNRYHFFLCRWPEKNEKGHAQWPNSEVVQAVSSNSIGPYKVVGNTIGKGHNPEIYQLRDGRYVIYVIDAYYISNSLNGPWKRNKFDFNPRDRKIIEGLSNLSFVKREDGSYLMVCRGGGIWVSETGISPWNQVTNKRVYPDIEGRFEDPVIWRTGFQYHMIVNDWYGRIAYYLRSKDGFSWKVEPGEAYLPGISKYEDGTVENWYKYERIKILQDEYGRAFQANFAVIDTLKKEDKGNDIHSSKNISIPINKEKFISVLNKKKISDATKEIKLKILAEEGFNPQTDVDVESLVLGASEEVNYGRGCKAVSSQTNGKDLIVVFDGKGNGITENNFAAKLLGKQKDGKLLYGYAQLPGIEYNCSVLSARKPVVKKIDNDTFIEFEVENFGQVESKPAEITLQINNENEKTVFKGNVKALKPFEKTLIKITGNEKIPVGIPCSLIILVDGKLQQLPLFEQDLVL